MSVKDDLHFINSAADFGLGAPDYTEAYQRVWKAVDQITDMETKLQAAEDGIRLAEELERLRASLKAAEHAYDDMRKIADDLQRELDCTCNAEEMRQVRAENQRLRDALKTIAGVVYSDPRGVYVMKSIARQALEGK